MKKTFLKRCTAVLISIVMMLSCMPHMAFAASEYLNITFDDEVTNAVPASVELAGSENSRVISLNDKNKVLSLCAGYVNNDMTVSLPDMSAADKYIIEFELMYQNLPVSGEIDLLTSSGAETTLLTIDSASNLISASGKSLGAVGKSRMTKISALFDNSFNTYSIYINDRCVLNEWDMPSTAYSALKISTFGANEAPCYLLADNIRVYEGEKPKKITKSSSVYNTDSMEFTEVDESQSGFSVFANIGMNESGKVNGVSTISKSNDIRHEFEGENGFLRMEKLASSTESLHIEAGIANTAQKLVVEYDIRFFDFSGSGMLFYMTDSSVSPAYASNLVSFTNNTVTAKGSSKELTSDTWHRLSLVANISTHTYDFYVDKKIVAKGVALAANFKALSKVRVFINAASSPGYIDVDNIRAYSGTELIDDLSDAPVSYTSIFSDKAAKTLLAGKTALSPYSNKIYYGNKKIDTDIPCIVSGDEALVSADTFSKLFSVTPEISGDNIKVGNASFTVGKTEMTANGNTVTIDVAPVISDGNFMIPADAYGKNVLGDKYYNDLRGMFLVSGSAIDTSNTKLTSPLRDASRYLLFDRYTAAELLEKTKNNLGGDLTLHPRVIANASDFARLKQEIKTDKYKKAWADGIIKQADGYISAGTNVIPDYDVSSGRLMDKVDTTNNLPVLSMAYQLTGDEKYGEKAIEGMLKLCEYPDWYPDHHLGTAEIEYGIAIGFDWCYDLLTEEQKQTIYKACKNMGFIPNSQVYYGTAGFQNSFWGKTDTNWGGVVNGDIISLCCSVMEMEPEYVSGILEQAMLSMEYPISVIAPDGAWHEGTNYWNYFFTNLGIGFAAYETTVGEINKGVYQKGMVGMCDFRTAIGDPLGYVAMYNDMSKSRVDCPSRLYIADKLDLGYTMKSFTDNIDEFTDVTGGDAVLALSWYDTGMTSSSENITYSLDSYFRESEVMTMRQAYKDKNALWVFADGGKADASHSHIDSGSFLFTLDGYQWATDLGTENAYYSRSGGNFAVAAGYTNNDYYRRKAEGHNCVVINPDKNIEMDKNADTKLIKPVSGIGRAYSYADLTDAYTSDRVNKYLRGYLLSEGRRSFTVRDEIDLAKADSEVWWFMNTDGTIQIVDNNTAIISNGNKQLKMQFVIEGENPTYELMSMPKKRLIDLGFAETVNSGEKIALKLKASGKLNITVKMAMIGDPQSSTPVETTPIAEWTAEGDDTIAPTQTPSSNATVKAIKVNGVEITGFSPENYSVSYIIDKTENAPTVEAVSDYRTEITKDSKDGTVTKYLIRAYDENNLCTIYEFKLNESTALITEGYDYYKVVKSDVSSEQTTATTSQNNLRYGSYDRDISTRWSANGDGEWLVHDLGEVKKLDAVAVAFYLGSARKYTFDIAVSADGVNYTPMITGMTSSGTTDSAEIYKFNQSVNARYVKFIGHGSNAGLWNNVVELISLVKKGA